MVNPHTSNGGGSRVPPSNKQPQDRTAGVGTPFVLSHDDVTFAPRYAPDTLRRDKERNLDRKDAFCEGENVSDNGSKNWNIHASGRMLTSEIKFFDKVAEKGEPLLLTSATWSGELLVEDVEVDGPGSWDPQQEEYHWTYTLNLVSTGRDESGENYPDGIIDDGT